MKLLATLLVTLFIGSVSATSSYYPTEYKALFQNKSAKDEELKEKIFVLLASVHMYKNGKDDTISAHCSGEGKCYEHRSIGYKGARKVLFGKLHLEEDGGGYFIKDVYCRKKITRNESRIGPNIIPNNNVLNCEHTWPQSKFSTSFPKGLQKSDLHHLFPTDSQANSIRGNNEFADVDGDALRDCDGSYYGVEKWQGGHFEPPKEHKGNVARALFYFSVRYKIHISASQEEYLREWHESDPVDQDEMERNDMIHTVQGNRNPFIDYPELAGQISDF